MNYQLLNDKMLSGKTLLNYCLHDFVKEKIVIRRFIILNTKNLGFLSLIIACFFTTLLSYQYWKLWNFDDAFIVYRIVNNIISYQDWSYNISENLNASTSVLNTILIAILSLATKNISDAAHMIGASCIFGSAILTYKIFNKNFNSTISTFVAFAIIATMSLNSTWGLEIHLFVFLTLLFISLTNGWITLGFLILTRPDGIIIFGLKIFNFIRNSQKFPIKGVLTSLSILIPWLVFSIITFKEVFPNTISHKFWQGSSGLWGQGWIYFNALKEFLTKDNYLRLLGLLFTIYSCFRLKKSDSRLWYLIIFALIQQLIYVLFNIPGYHWYFAIFEVSLVLGSSWVIAEIITTAFKNFNIKLFDLIPIATSVLFLLFWSKYLNTSTLLEPKTESYRRTITLIDQKIDKSVNLGVLEAGVPGFYTSRKIVDLTGLTSTNLEYVTGKNNDKFFSNPPKILLLHEPPWHFERAVFDDLRFKIMYRHLFVSQDPYMPMSVYQIDRSISQPSESDINNYIKAHYQPPKTSNIILEQLEIPDPEAVCIIDQINGSIVKSDKIIINKVLSLHGWAVELNSTNLDTNPTLLLVNAKASYQFPLSRRQRPDVALHLANSLFNNSGIIGEFSLTGIPKGDYEIAIQQYSKIVGDNIFCAPKVRLEVK
jgi:hypothetical protein